MLFASSPAAPALTHTYAKPVRALYVRTQYNAANSYNDSAGVCAVDVLGLDAAPAEATRALISKREGSNHVKIWVEVTALASSPVEAGKKMAAHFSALLAAQRPAKMPVTTTAGSAEVSSL